MVDDIVEDPRRTAADYDDGTTQLIESCLLHVATVLGDLMRDSIVVVGGLVPRLLITQGALPPGAAVHPGTTDLDLGLRLALLVEERYQEISRRLREADFEMDVNAAGNRTHQRWRREARGSGVARVDFLDIDALGPVRAASFIAHDPDDALRADVAAFVEDFLDAVRVAEE